MAMKIHQIFPFVKFLLQTVHSFAILLYISLYEYI